MDANCTPRAQEQVTVWRRVGWELCHELCWSDAPHKSPSDTIFLAYTGPPRSLTATLGVPLTVPPPPIAWLEGPPTNAMYNF